MSAPQGRMEFPGLTDYLLSGQFTLQHGISPSICNIVCAPVPKNQLVEQGKLTLRFGSTLIAFPHCKIDKIDAFQNEDGFIRWSVSILDRRWRWKFAGFVSGHWNVRKGEVLVGQNLAVPQTKSAKQLAEICLKAMNEAAFDTSELPKDIFPEVKWDLTNAAQALAQLCDPLGFRIVLEINDRVAIRKVGVGRKIPILGLETQLSVTIDPPERPENLVFAGNPNRHQFDLELEPVLRDFDGMFRHIDQVSYAPKGLDGKALWGCAGFGQFTEDQIAANPKLRLYNTYITENLWRTWRIKEPFQIEIWAEGAVRLRKLNRINIVPLEATLVATETNDKDVAEGGDVNRRAFTQEREPMIYGLWSGGGTGNESTYHVLDADGYETQPTGDVAVLKDPLDPLTLAVGKCAKALYTLPYEINFETGYVQFANEVVRFLPSTAAEDARYGVTTVLDGASLRSWNTMPGRMWLRVSFAVRYNQLDGLPLLYAPIVRKLQVPGVGFGVEYVRATDIRYWLGRVKDGPLIGNSEEYLKAANGYLDAREKDYQAGEIGSATVGGFQPYNPDGALQQVSWEVTGEGFAYTRVSRNKEEVFAGVSYTERRLYEKTKALLDAAALKPAGA